MNHVSQYLDGLARLQVPFIMDLQSGLPVVIEHAEGIYVWDVDGKKYLDLTAFFGAALVGHSNQAVVKAIQQQAARLIHGMGDVHPPAVAADFMSELQARMGSDEYRFYMGLNGSDAVETALKIAFATTQRPGVIAFEGGYHGLYGGALRVTHRPDFRVPFASITGPGAEFLPWPGQKSADSVLERVGSLLETGRYGTVIIEPLQGRGGIRQLPAGFLPQLQALVRRYDGILIVDEVFTGVHRTGPFLACLGMGVQADIICMGKALGGGMPISVTAALPRALAGMGTAKNEAIHTATFVFNPLSAAAGLAVLREIRRLALDNRATEVEHAFYGFFDSIRIPGAIARIRGKGGMLGIELQPWVRPSQITGLLLSLRDQGILVLPAGPRGNVIELTPPLVIDTDTFVHALEVITGCIADIRQ